MGFAKFSAYSVFLVLVCGGNARAGQGTWAFKSDDLVSQIDLTLGGSTLTGSVTQKDGTTAKVNLVLANGTWSGDWAGNTIEISPLKTADFKTIDLKIQQGTVLATDSIVVNAGADQTQYFSSIGGSAIQPGEHSFGYTETYDRVDVELALVRAGHYEGSGMTGEVISSVSTLDVTGDLDPFVLYLRDPGLFAFLDSYAYVLAVLSKP